MNISCILGIILLLSSIFINFYKDERIFSEFMNSLDNKQREIYHKIVRERIMIYTLGLFLGTVIGIYYYIYL